MNDALDLRDSGLNKMHASDYSGAIEDFTKAIGTDDPETDEEAVLKSICLLHRSTCNLMLNKVGDAFEDASYAVYMFKIRRPKFKLSDQFESSDPLITTYLLAEKTKAEIYQLIRDLKSSIQSYTIYGILSKSDPTSLMDGVYAKLGFPKIEGNDPELEIFTKIYSSLSTEKQILLVLSDIITVFQEEVSPSFIEKVRSQGCYVFLFGITYLFIDCPVVLQACLCILRNMAELGISEIFDGLIVLRNIIEHYQTNNEMMGALLLLLKLAPDSAVQQFEIEDFVRPIMKMLTLKLTPEEYDAAFYLLFRSIKIPYNYKAASELKLIDAIIAIATKSSIVLLSKLLCNDELCVESQIKGAIPFCIAVIKKVSDVSLITTSLICIAKILLLDIPDNKRFYAQIITSIIPIVVKNSKPPGIVSNAFACLTICVDGASDAIKESKAVRAASVILSLYSHDIEIAKNIVSFFYAASLCGLADEINANPAALNTILSVVTEFIAEKDVAVKGIATAIYCNHPMKIKLATIGLKTYKDSPVLISAVASIQDELRSSLK
ncbi:hypothetical protein TVAG_100380 [Trichomonas vaginalis G3]|uniref:TPR Domain containing protein n=1 Tax=Trichomonas vaginalis (strain ATCC PRA-98 / G3) TaxID=412133 RepID=A2ENL5_TRIV3|nr:armadillo (ARM) repeat-containing protein family [Trichomonas vaginalis G3]EAY05715.1 hypothetical protein TVAG_100380 [Trichomonas vaginalis G3]KAI5535182.1 armadillo (ARM) repeat-containing protein family [Trichomonas vaginalis G3]|eukprot:XP_001317938.1 hypothetical protein [Trichomonas vaginalis G3]